LSESERTKFGTAHFAPAAMLVAEVIDTHRSLAGIGIRQAISNRPNVREIKPVVTFDREIIAAVAGY
jgi:hypothetical protein